MTTKGPNKEDKVPEVEVSEITPNIRDEYDSDNCKSDANSSGE